MPKGNCIRCYFGGGKPATDTIVVRYGSSDYELDFCAKHAAEFDDSMWGWLRTARVKNDDNFANGVASLTETARLAPAPAPQHTPEQHASFTEPRPQLMGVVQRGPTRSEIDVLRLRWIMTDHASERLAERGPLFGFSIEDVLRTAEYPERAHRDRSGEQLDENVWVHWRGNVKVVVNREEHVILTVAGRNVVAHAM